jgi:GNAT superfamily N-acetyltransferase
MAIVYRAARADELQATQEHIVRSINELSERHGFGPMASVRAPDFQLFSLEDDPAGLWTAEENGQIVGSAFSWICGDLWFLAELFISPGRQGQGIGNELLKRTLNHAANAGAKRKALFTFTFVVPGAGHFWSVDPVDEGFGAYAGPKVLRFLEGAL